MASERGGGGASYTHTVVIEFSDTCLRVGLSGETLQRFVISYDELSTKLCMRTETDITRLYMLVTELLHKVFMHYVAIKPKDCRVLVIEKMFATKYLRDVILTTLLRESQVHSVSMQPDLLMPCIASGKSSCMVVDIGEYETRVIAVSHGRPMMYTMKVSSIGVANAADRFQSMLHELVDNEVETGASRSLFDKAACYMSESLTAEIGLKCPSMECNAMSGISDAPFVLSSAMRQECLKALVCGSVTEDGDVTDDVDGVAELILQVLQACNRDSRPLVSQCIVFAGVGSSIPGVAESIISEAMLMANSYDEYTELQSLLASRPLAAHRTPFSGVALAWIGGSLFASIKSNDSKFVRSNMLSSYSTGEASKLVDVSILRKRSASSTKRLSSYYKDDEDEDTNVFPSTLLQAPDWMSIYPNEWTFFGPR